MVEARKIARGPTDIAFNHHLTTAAAGFCISPYSSEGPAPASYPGVHRRSSGNSPECSNTPLHRHPSHTHPHLTSDRRLEKLKGVRAQSDDWDMRELQRRREFIYLSKSHQQRD